MVEKCTCETRLGNQLDVTFLKLSNLTKRVIEPAFDALANMLMGSKINPFTSQEAKPYEFHPEVKAMTLKAFDNNQIQKFESTLKKNRNSILRDPFIRMYVEELLSTVRVKHTKNN